MNHRLYRSRNDKMVAGVCAGIAEYFDMDPTIVRILFVLLSLGPLPGVAVYFILMFIMPEAPLIEGPTTTERPVMEEPIL